MGFVSGNVYVESYSEKLDFLSKDILGRKDLKSLSGKTICQITLK